MKKITGLMMLLAGAAGYAVAGGTALAPEIDASSATAAIALISGGMVVLWGRRTR